MEDFRSCYSVRTWTSIPDYEILAKYIYRVERDICLTMATLFTAPLNDFVMPIWDDKYGNGKILVINNFN